MKQFNVIIYDFNKDDYVPYNIIPYLVEKYKEDRSKPKTFKDFKNFIIAEAKYQWWARCEYEIILSDWPNENLHKKVDVFWQIMLNIDLVTEIVMEETLNKPKIDL